MKQSKLSAIANTISWKIRQVKKLVFYHKKATSAFWENQQVIVDTLRKEKEIYLNPVPPYGGDGTSENYFHFIFDLLLPLYLIIQKVPDAKIGLPFVKLGYLKSYLKKLFPNQLFDSSQLHPADLEIEMHGMNPLLVELDKSMMRSFKSYLVNTLKIRLSQKRDQVVLIERTEPPGHVYPNEQNGAGTGLYKRHIKNHELVKSYLHEHLNDNYELINAKLEFYTLEEQIRLFDRAAMVIAQHGAGLANICWMRPRSQVIEIKNDLLRMHYVYLSKYADLDYHYLYHRGMHIELNFEKLVRLLSSSTTKNQLFNA